MTRPSDLQLVPNKYEILKLDTGQEIIGMTRQVGEVVEITLPMICHLSVTMKGKTLATFYPYSPLTSDTTIKIPQDMILHRNILNVQMVPLYDNAATSWVKMLENQSIPLANKLSKDDDVTIRNHVDELIKQLYEDKHMATEEEFLEMMEREYLKSQEEENDPYKEFKRLTTPKDKKKIH